MRADTRLPPYLPYPRFLLQADLTQTAKLLYALLLDRATLSQANGWLDEGGRIYLVFPIQKHHDRENRSFRVGGRGADQAAQERLFQAEPHLCEDAARRTENFPSDRQKAFLYWDRKLSD